MSTVVLLVAASCGDPNCKPGQTACDGSCVDVEADPGNCGSCGHGCAVGEYCSAAVCAANCLAGTSVCGDACVDLERDHDQCGNCGHACASGEVCNGGVCESSCGSNTTCSDHCADLMTDNGDCGACGHVCTRGELCVMGTCSAPPIEHVVLIVEENHTFDSYFGAYCTAPAGSNPSCTTGRGCCEAAPATEPSGSAPIALDDTANEFKDRDHDGVCEVAQIDGGLMDHYVVGSNVMVSLTEGIYTYECSDPNNFAIADASTMQTYWTYADRGALADRYFQPMVGSTSGNDMYLAVAQWQFADNADRPITIGSGCLGPGANATEFGHIATVADLLIGHGATFRMYADGYADAVAAAPACASTAGVFPADCEATERTSAFSTCNYDPSDLPFEYYVQFADNKDHLSDFSQFATDLGAGTLPSFAYIKPRTYTNEHPKWSTISRGVTFVQNVVSAIESSAYAQNTLILLTWDEGGGFYDHVSPPAALGTQYDKDDSGAPVPYGTRVPLIAIGPYAQSGAISHATLEHSSIVRFLEENFLGARYAGALGHRDAAVADLRSLLVPSTQVSP